MKNYTLLLLFFTFSLACTNASLLDFIRLDRKRRQYPSECCMPPTVMTCCPSNSGAMVAAPTGTEYSAMDEESRDMYNAWNAPVALGVFINPEASPDEPKVAKRAETPFHQNEGSGSGSGGSYFTSDSAKRDEVPKKPVDKQENVKKSTIETVNEKSSNQVEAKEKVAVESNEKKSELSAKASEIEEVQGGLDKDKRKTTITCQGQKDWLQCPTYQLIKIKDAFWGRDDEKTCSRSHTERSLQTTKMCAQDESNTMAKLQNACDGESACELVASPVYFDRTDCPEVYKYLRVNWECAHSESRIKA